MQKKKGRTSKKVVEREKKVNLIDEVSETIEKRLDNVLEKYKDADDEDKEIVLESVSGILKEHKLPEILKPIEKIVDNIKESENVNEVDRKDIKLDSLPGYSFDDDNYEKLHKISNENFKESLKNQMNENASESDLKSIFNLLKGDETNINIVSLKSMINNIFDDDKKEGTVDPEQVEEEYSIKKLMNLIKRGADDNDYINFEQFKKLMQRTYY